MNDLLTKRMKELVSVIGHEPAMVLIENFGGVSLLIPKNPKPKHQLAVLIGMEAFKKLTQYYAGTLLEVDLCLAITRNKRNKLILEDIKTMTRRNVALKYATTERNIRRIIHKSRLNNVLSS
jgi:hypothetical protein